jgi:Ca2+-binding EF-hand superfamily protein
MKRHLAWVVMMALAASPSLAEDVKAKVPGKRGAADGQRGPLTPEMMKQLLEKFDTNKDGRLSAEEKANAQAEMMKKAGPGLEEFLKRFDRDGNGRLDEREQAAARQAAQKIRAQGGGGPQVGPPITFAGNEIPTAVLEKFDKDGDGKLNDKEMAAAKKASGKRERVKQSEVIKEFDEDGDGKLNAEEKAAARKAAKERNKKTE